MKYDKRNETNVPTLAIKAVIVKEKILNLKMRHQGEFSLVASIKVKFLASVTKNVVLSF